MPLYKVDTDEVEGDEELTVLQLKEDKLLAGFIPLLAAPQEPCYIDKHTEMVNVKKKELTYYMIHTFIPVKLLSVCR